MTEKEIENQIKRTLAKLSAAEKLRNRSLERQACRLLRALYTMKIALKGAIEMEGT